jgi:antitoxin component HigA of HigAB toxin-antitoxin module
MMPAPTLTLAFEVTPEWQAAAMCRMRDAGLSMSGLAKIVGTSQAAISYVLTRARSSALVPRIDAAFEVFFATPKADPGPAPEIAPEILAEVAVLREDRDAIHADIVRLEGVRATVEERLVEAYEHQAQLDVRIRQLRGGPV